MTNIRKNNAKVFSSIENSKLSGSFQKVDVFDPVSSSFLNEEKMPDANSEKELGNAYFKQKKYLEAIECYSRSIAFTPTAVAFANRAMAHLKLKKFEEADIDCTYALNLDDRYVKAYSRRAASRKALMKLEGAMEDADFALRLEPNNPEIRKQYSEIKEILERVNGKINEDREASSKFTMTNVRKNHAKVVSSIENSKLSGSPKKLDAFDLVSSSFLNEEKLPDANSEKELGNTYFEQKKYLEAIECYSRSIAFTPTAVAFANRAMAHLKVKKFEEADIDCTYALNLDDKYVKAYSRRAASRKALMKLQGAMEDADFALRLEPNNPEIRKQYSEIKEILERDRASHAACRVMKTVSKNVTAPTSAYEFEVSWRSLSNESEKQRQLLKIISPADLPKIFKNALSAPVLIDIIRCVATFFTDDPVLAVSMLDYLTKVPRFDMIIMCLSTMDRAELHRLWEEVFSSDQVAGDLKQVLIRLRPKYFLGA